MEAFLSCAMIDSLCSRHLKQIGRPSRDDCAHAILRRGEPTAASPSASIKRSFGETGCVELSISAIWAFI